MEHLLKSSDHTEILITFTPGLTCIPPLQGQRVPIEGSVGGSSFLIALRGNRLPKSNIGTGHWFNHTQYSCRARARRNCHEVIVRGCLGLVSS